MEVNPLVQLIFKDKKSRNLDKYVASTSMLVTQCYVTMVMYIAQLRD